MRCAITGSSCWHARIRSPASAIAWRSTHHSPPNWPAHRFGHPFALLVVDIDHFKRINDCFGHSAGDQVLRTVAAQITDCLRPYDQAFRFGGEEFVVMLSQTAQVKGMEIAERIRQRIATHRKPDGGSAPTITVSIGCGEFRHDETIGELFDRADRALYAAKNQGRNRVVAAS
ncbi:MAG: GGDEF domain-containing protein [Gammaproteobacteria bacterium]|nr:GGDEF domain-containing protein [Gammaproteobacteria bacterium]